MRTRWLSNPYRRGEDDLGPIYGVQWRAWPVYKLIERNTPAYKARLADARARGYQCLGVIEEIDEEGRTTRALMHRKVDQLRECLHTIIHNPGDRRILFHSWNVAQLEEMALPSCPTLWQFHVNQERHELSLNLFIRSSDIGLGLVWNCAEAAALLHLVARLTGYKARWLSMMLGDAHIYENQIEMLREQLTREPFPLPTLVISERVPSYQATGVCEPEWLESVEPRDFWLEGYEHHPPLSAAMAV